MNIQVVRSDKLYKKMMATSSKEEKEDIYRYELMKPFEYKWKCFGIPLKAKEEGGYDVVSASSMGGGYHPSEITPERLSEITQISDNEFWRLCEESIRKTFEGFQNHGIILPVQNYVFTILLNNPNNQMSSMTGDYCGDGGIPGFITGSIVPNQLAKEMLPVALAHEANHNVRWQFMKWSTKITLADMIISEGLAESFEVFMYGEDKLGKWVKNTNEETLEKVIKPLIKNNLFESDFNTLSSFLYGDDIMILRGAKPIGMPYCGGYACGYALIQYYLHKTNISIYDATITSTSEIMKETEDFWK